MMDDQQITQFKEWLEQTFDPPLTTEEITAARDWFSGKSQFWIFRCKFENNTKTEKTMNT